LRGPIIWEPEHGSASEEHEAVRVLIGRRLIIDQEEDGLTITKMTGRFSSCALRAILWEGSLLPVRDLIVVVEA
jgi:hypothetical protein